MNSLSTVTLYRPVGSKELELIRQSDFRAFPPRLSWQPIFYPVTNEAYAIRIARDWNVKESGAGCVTRFQVNANYLKKFPIQTVGSSEHQEYWIPAEELEAFNQNIVGQIEIIAEFDLTNDDDSLHRDTGCWKIDLLQTTIFQQSRPRQPGHAAHS